jgi:hypothetical protein
MEQDTLGLKDTQKNVQKMEIPTRLLDNLAMDRKNSGLSPNNKMYLKPGQIYYACIVFLQFNGYI